MWKPRKALHDAKQTFLCFIFLTVEKNLVTHGKRHTYDIYAYMTQLLLLGKVEYGGGPIFKVVLEC